MPSQQQSPPRRQPIPTYITSYGQAVEYLTDRLYFQSYKQPPSSNTPFLYPLRDSRSPQKRTSKATGGAEEPTPTHKRLQAIYFTIDEILLYNKFHADFGPFHIGHLYRFVNVLHEILADPSNDDKAIVFWSRPDSRSRANATCLLACYMVFIQDWAPHQAIAPLAQMDPPCMPFRDAGYSQADFILTIQDIVYGLWKAKEERLCGFKHFSIEEYEAFERVDMGDFNWVTPQFIAFASPQHAPVKIPPESSLYEKLPKSLNALEKADIPFPFKNVLYQFASRGVGLVVRLNSELYSPSYFTALGIDHIDMIFNDGTCPPFHLVKRFIRLAHDTINVRRKQVAVHCKAGLGRTGCLIGAYLIYRHGFTANEIIGFMRFIRPGMVVGPQQHWLHINQGIFREWYYEDRMRERLAALRPTTPTKSPAKQRLSSHGQTLTPPNGSLKRPALGEIQSNERTSGGSHDDNLPAPTPGQPRKTGKVYSAVRAYQHHKGYENTPLGSPVADLLSTSRVKQGDSESDEEFHLRLLAMRASRSPLSGREKRRTLSCTTATATVISTSSANWETIPGGGSDVENRSAAPKTPANVKSGSGNGMISIGKARASPSRRSTETRSGVRKTSGRIGSIGGTIKTK